MAEKKIAIVPGDGIGVDVTREAEKVIKCLGEVSGVAFRLEHYDYSADRYLKTGVTMPPGALDEFRSFDAIFMGAFGDPRVPDMRHAAEILLGTRFGLDLYINHRPGRRAGATTAKSKPQYPNVFPMAQPLLHDRA